MEMLPDYPDRVVAEHLARVARVSLVCQLILITIGAYWLFSSFGLDKPYMERFGPVAVLFSAALILPDLVDFGPVQRTRISTVCCISWPPLLSFAEVSRSEGAEVIGVIPLFLSSAFLYQSSRIILKIDVNSIRWRGLMTTFGFGLAIPVVLASPSLESLLIVGAIALPTTIPPLLTKDGKEGERQDFSRRLTKVESTILQMQTGNNLLQQPTSLLKTAREEGWKNPEKGLELITEAERETSRILSYIEDINEVMEQSKKALARSEEITGYRGISRGIFEEALGELDNGSLRAAENKFRESKLRSETIEAHWENAQDAIDLAEKSISNGGGHLVEGLQKTLEDAKNAMKDENPEYALAIVSEIPSQMGDVQDLMEQAQKTVKDAKNEISSSDSSSIDELKIRLNESKEAFEAGNASLAIGLADGITRFLRKEASSKTSVQRGLRQRKAIEEKIPSGDIGSQWRDRLEEVILLTESGDWIDADELLSGLTSELDSLSSRISEAKEMLDFLSKDWIKLRNRLESSGIAPDNDLRVETEKSLSEAERDLSRGEVDSCLHKLGTADTSMEGLRRLV